MRKATAYHLSTDAQPIPKQQLPHGQLPTDVKFFSHCVIFTEYPFGLLAVLILFSASFLCPLSNPGWLAGRTVQEVEKSLALCSYCSATTETSVCYQYCFSPTAKT